MIATCPHCGRTVYLSKIGTEPAVRPQMKTLELSMSAPWMSSDDVPARPDFAEWERREPVRAATWESDVIVCWGQAVISGAFITMFASGLVIWREWPWFVAFIPGAFTAAAVWFVTMSDARSMLRRVETIINRDLDGDGFKGEPVEHRTVIEGRIGDGEHVKDFVLYFDGVEPERIETLFRAALGGASLSEPAWCGAGKPFSKKQFVGVRDRMIDAGLWGWVNDEAHRQGVRVSAAGRALMSRWLEQFVRAHSHARTGY